MGNVESRGAGGFFGQPWGRPAPGSELTELEGGVGSSELLSALSPIAGSWLWLSLPAGQGAPGHGMAPGWVWPSGRAGAPALRLAGAMALEDPHVTQRPSAAAQPMASKPFGVGSCRLGELSWPDRSGIAFGKLCQVLACVDTQFHKPPEDADSAWKPCQRRRSSKKVGCQHCLDRALYQKPFILPLLCIIPFGVALDV